MKALPDTFLLAVGPLAVYLLILGMVNLSRRPVVVSGTRETLALGLALAGLMIVGPMRLFMPQEAAAVFGPWVWALLVSFYGLALTLLLMFSRPRIVIYNRSFEQVQAVLAEAAKRLDPDAAWAGNALSMPGVRVHLRLENFAPMHNLTLVANDLDQSASGWQRLEIELRQALRDMPVSGRVHGGCVLLVALLILTVLALRVAEDPQTIARELMDLLVP